ncbi:MAG: hypothetical protein ACO3IB_09665, partial [Phycisphaerales bacterium]
ITAEEKTLLEQRLSELRANDKVLIQRIAEARALGDLRENAEYHASREDKAMNDAKIKELEERLATAQVADASAMPADMVFVGAIVRLRDEDRGDDALYRLVGQATGRFDHHEPDGRVADEGARGRVDSRRSSARCQAIHHRRHRDLTRFLAPSGRSWMLDHEP